MIFDVVGSRLSRGHLPGRGAAHDRPEEVPRPHLSGRIRGQSHIVSGMPPRIICRHHDVFIRCTPYICVPYSSLDGMSACPGSSRSPTPCTVARAHVTPVTCVTCVTYESNRQPWHVHTAGRGSSGRQQSRPFTRTTRVLVTRTANQARYCSSDHMLQLVTPIKKPPH